MPTDKHKRIRMTAKRLAALHHQISIDDLLFEKFRRMNEELRRETQRQMRLDIEVVALTKTKGVTENLRIVKIERVPTFVRVTVAK